MRSSIVYATMIILLSLIPIYLLSGLTGTFFRPLVLSYGLAVVASLLVALTITPALSMLLLSRAPLKRQDPPLVAWLKRGYAWLLSRVIHRPRPAYLVVAPDGAGRACGRAVPRRVAGADVQGAQLPRALHHQAGHVAHGGDAHDRARPARPEEGPGRPARGHPHRAGLPGGRGRRRELRRGLDRIDPHANYEKTVAQIQEVVDRYPGAFHDVQTYLNERIDEVLTGSSDPIVIRIFGNDLETPPPGRPTTCGRPSRTSRA